MSYLVTSEATGYNLGVGRNPGPHEYSGNIFAAIQGDYAIEIWKSSDGISWTHVGSGSEIAIPMNAFDTVRIGNSLAFITTNESNELGVLTFDLESEAWGSANWGSIVLGATAVMAAARPDGSLIVLYARQDETYSYVTYVTYSGGSWGTPTDIFAPELHYLNPVSICIDQASGMAHAFVVYANLSELLHQSIASNGALGSIQTISTVASPYPSPQSAIVDGIVYMPYNEPGEGVGAVHIVSGTASDANPTWVDNELWTGDGNYLRDFIVAFDADGATVSWTLCDQTTTTVYKSSLASGWVVETLLSTTDVGDTVEAFGAYVNSQFAMLSVTWVGPTDEYSVYVLASGAPVARTGRWYAY